MTTRSNRNTGGARRHRGSGCVGTLPVGKPGDPSTRNKTKPHRQGKHTTPEYHEAVMRGRRLQAGLVMRAWVPRRTSIADAVRRVLGR